MPCDAGYICLGGSDVPRPTDNVIGYICPEGHYCLSAAVKETPCEKGYYAPAQGLGKYRVFTPNFTTNREKVDLQLK